MRLVVALLFALSFVAPAHASVLRIDLTKANQARAPLKFAVHTSTASGMTIVKLEVPRKQGPLAYLWRVDVVMRSGNKTLLSAPLATTVANDTLEAELLLDPGKLAGTEIWIRTGEHAPLAETIYVVDVGSFK